MISTLEPTAPTRPGAVSDSGRPTRAAAEEVVLERGRSVEDRSERGASLPRAAREAVVLERGRSVEDRSERGASLPRAAREAVVLELGRSLHALGAPAHRLEDEMSAAAEALGVEAQFFATPTSILASFGPPSDQRAVMVRVRPGDIDLDKLSSTEEIARAVGAGRLTATRGIEALVQVRNAPARYGAVLTTVAYGGASAGAAALFGGERVAVIAALLVGLVTGSLGSFAQRHTNLHRAFVVMAAFFGTALAMVVARGAGPESAAIATLAGLIVLLPGMTITVAMTELATQNLQSGSARLAGAFSVFLELGIGVALGREVGMRLPGLSLQAGMGLPPFAMTAIGLMLAAVAFTVLFRARPRDFVWVLAASVLGFVGGRIGGVWVGPELGAVIGAVLVGASGNAFARIFDRPASVMHAPGLMLLVPGSVGFRGLAHFLNHDVALAMESIFQMFLIAGALAAGFLLANLLVAPRKATPASAGHFPRPPAPAAATRAS